jgi:hypothetical protein
MRVNDRDSRRNLLRQMFESVVVTATVRIEHSSRG